MAGMRSGSLGAGTIARKLIFAALGAFLLAAGITFLYLGMRAVMDVGGFCAEGGPYEIRQECPDGGGFMFVGVFVALIGAGVIVAGTFRNGPRLWGLAWVLGFLALGWNFLEYAIDPPPGMDGPAIGWWICAVVFVGIAVLPAVPMFRDPRAVFWGRDDDELTTSSSLASRLFGPRGSATAPGWSAGPSGSTGGFVIRLGADDGPTIVVDGAGDVGVADAATGTGTGGGPGDPNDLVDDLERLADLHRSGALSDEEYARAKAARLAEEGS